MTYRTKSALMLLAMLIIGIVIGALGSGTVRSTRERRFQRMPPGERLFGVMERVIRPTEEQREAFGQIMHKHAEKVTKLLEDHEDDLFAIYDSLHAELKTILTPEQRIRLEQHLSRSSKRVSEDRLARLAQELKLTPEQLQQLREIFSALPRPWVREQMPASPGDRRKVFRQRRRKVNAELRRVLTAEQFEKFRKMRMHVPPFFRGRPPGDPEFDPGPPPPPPRPQDREDSVW